MVYDVALALRQPRHTRPNTPVLHLALSSLNHLEAGTSQILEAHNAADLYG